MTDIDIDLSSVLKLPEMPKEMLSVRTEGQQKIVKINFSSLSVLQECWRKSQYYFVNGLKSNIESEATLFGSAIHSALEVFYSAPKSERKLTKNFREELALMASLGADPKDDALIYRAATAFIERGAALRGLPDDNIRSISNGLWILSYYFEKYIDDPYETLFDKDNKPYVEQSFITPIYEDPLLKIELFGKIDLILKNPMTGQILVADHKTTTRMGNEFFKRIQPNFQYTYYLYGAKHALGLDVDTFLVNGVQVKGKPKTARGTPPDFPRQLTKRTEEDFDELRTAVVYYSKEYIKHMAEGQWPMATPNACTMYSGCQYHDICSTPKSIRDAVIKNSYSQRGIK